MKKSVYVLQDCEKSCVEIVKAIGENDEFTVKERFTDGITAVAAVIQDKPDYLITGLVIAGYDGISVTEKIKESGIKTKIIAVTALTSEEAIGKAVKAGVDYYLAKPVNGEILKKRMREIGEGREGTRYGEEIKQSTLEEKISKIFINVGIPPHIKGYNFLREGVKMVVENPEIINSITKELYPRIGEKYHTTASKVERAIRHAIEVAWNRGRIDTINGILGVRAYVGSEKPTNGEFIALIADKMQLEQTR